MTLVYAFVNQKGGVGKTTTVINLATYLANNKKKTLLIDFDPQANATSGIGLDKHAVEESSYDVLIGDSSVKEAVVAEHLTNLDILPSSADLAGAEVELVNMVGREYKLKEALKSVKQYDYILIDCPPSLGMLTLNALTAADSVIIPVQTEYLALEGLSQLNETISLVKAHLNPDLDIRGIIMTMYDGRTNLSRQVVEEVKTHFPDKVFRAIIPRNIRLSEAPSFGQPIAEYAGNSAGAVAYRVLATEILRGDK